MADETEDEGVTSQTRGSGQAVSIKLVGVDGPFFRSIALALSIFASIFASIFTFMVWQWEEKRVYYTQRCEAFIEQIAFEGYDKAYTHAPVEIKTDCVVVINREGTKP